MFVGLQRTVGASSLLLSDLLATAVCGRLCAPFACMSACRALGQSDRQSLDWTLPAANFSNVLSIYGGHFLDMLFHAVGQPVALECNVEDAVPGTCRWATALGYGTRALTP